MQVIAVLHPPVAPQQQLASVEILPSPRQATQTLSDPSAASGDVLAALMTLAVTGAGGSRATAGMVKAGCIEALAERLRMSPGNRAGPKDERRCGLGMSPLLNLRTELVIIIFT